MPELNVWQLLLGERILWGRRHRARTAEQDARLRMELVRWGRWLVLMEVVDRERRARDRRLAIAARGMGGVERLLRTVERVARSRLELVLEWWKLVYGRY